MRSLQLYIKLLNIVHSDMIFTWKLLSIFTCITSGYAAIAYFRSYPIFGLMYYGIFLDVALFYTIPYEKAFKIPALFSQVRSHLHVHASILGRAERKIMRRRVRSIQAAGTKVGEFHMLERTSTPVFVNYVLCNIVNMLVAFG